MNNETITQKAFIGMDVSEKNYLQRHRFLQFLCKLILSDFVKNFIDTPGSDYSGVLRLRIYSLKINCAIWDHKFS